MTVVIDASAAIEFLLQSSLGLRVASFLDDADVAAPELLDAEVLAVLRRAARVGKLNERRAAEALDDLRDWGIERLSHRALLAGAWELRGHVSAYDALYVEAARQRDASLITADGPLSRATGLGITVHNVRTV